MSEDSVPCPYQTDIIPLATFRFTSRRGDIKKEPLDGILKD